MSKLLFDNEEWTLDSVDKCWRVLDSIAKEKYGLDYYPPQIEIVTATQMLERSSSTGMPMMYDHWSFGKSYITMEKEYLAGRTSLAYEMVINTNPSLAFIMESNTMTMQALVLAHSICGHGSFFKTNYLFTEHTDPEYILDYLKYAREYVSVCERRYGPRAVELTLDSCHALYWQGITKTRRKRVSLSLDELQQKISELENDNRKFATPLDKVLPKKPKPNKKRLESNFDWPFPEENILYFIEKHSPTLHTWQRELVRIVRQIAQYFYPQVQTKLMNEGWASFWHHTLMTDLWEEGYITEGSYLEFLKSHCGVCTQHGLEDTDEYLSFNPYALGFAMYKDIRRICENPTAEDREWFPDIAGKDWLETVKYVTENYKDDSFVAQFLSPKLIREFKMFSVSDHEESEKYTIRGVQDGDYEDIRRVLSKQYDFNARTPIVEIVDFDARGTGALTLRHRADRGMALDKKRAKETCKHLKRLWDKPIYLDSEYDGKVQRVVTREH